MTHRLHNRVKKLESARPDDRTEWLRTLSEHSLDRLIFLTNKRDFFGITGDELEELLAIDGSESPEKGPFEIDESHQKDINKWSINFLNYRQFASEPVWLADRNHVLDAIGCFAVIIEEAILSEELVETMALLIKRLNGRYTWAYEPPFTDEEADKVTEALAGENLGMYGPWFREYLRAHADLGEYYRHCFANHAVI